MQKENDQEIAPVHNDAIIGLSSAAINSNKQEVLQTAAPTSINTSYVDSCTTINSKQDSSANELVKRVDVAKVPPPVPAVRWSKLAQTTNPNAQKENIYMNLDVIKSSLDSLQAGNNSFINCTPGRDRIGANSNLGFLPEVHMQYAEPVEVDGSVIAYVVRDDDQGVGLFAEETIYRQNTNQVLAIASIGGIGLAILMGIGLARLLIQPI